MLDQEIISHYFDTLFWIVHGKKTHGFYTKILIFVTYQPIKNLSNVMLL